MKLISSDYRSQIWNNAVQIKTKLPKKSVSLLFIGLIIVFFGATEIFSYFLVRNSILQSLKANEMIKIQQAGDEVDQWLATLRAQVEVLANTDYSRTVNWTVAEPYLQLELERSPDFLWFTMAKLDGTYYNNKKGLVKGFNLKSRVYFQKAIAGLSRIDDPIVGYTTGKRENHIAVPIWSVPPFNRGKLTTKKIAIRTHSLAALKLPTDLGQKPHVVGVFAGTIGLEAISEIVKKIRLGKGSYVFALDSQGKIIIDSDQTLLDKKTGLLDIPNSGLAKIAHSMLNRKQGISLVRISQKWFYVAYLPLKQVNWSLALVIPQENLESKLLPLNLLVSIIIIILTIGLWFAIKFIKLFEQTQAQAEELQMAYNALQNTQSQLIQSEKMSSLGQLVAGIAHEINNPVNFICANIQPATEHTNYLLYMLQHYQESYPQPAPIIQAELETGELDFIIEDLPKILNSMKVGAERIYGIVLSLRTFSRLDEAEVKKVDIHDGLESTLMILQNRLKAKLGNPEIQIVKEYGQLPLIECYAGQLNQVFMNILVNAIDAMDERNSQRSPQEIRDFPSLIIIRTEFLDHHQEIGSVQASYPVPSVIIRIIDNGTGISKQTQANMFNPFFTTKDVGKGTGLGLSISYQIIVDRHHGKLECNSTLDKGTEFIIVIPVTQVGESILV